MYVDHQVEDLARLSIKNKPVYVGVDDAEQESTVDGLEQVGVLVGHYEQRLSPLEASADRAASGSRMRD